MSDPELRMAILREMASIRRELTDLANTMKPPLGPRDFVDRYIEQLKTRLGQLEEELKRTETAAD